LLYLLDANVLIDANRDYYPISRVPEYWSWLVYCGEREQIKVPREICEDIFKVTDALSDWLMDNMQSMILDESVQQDLLNRVTNDGYATDLTDEEMTTMGSDPFLIAYALASPERRFVVTTEASRPTRTRANRHVPDVCRDVGVSCYTPFALLRRLDFSTSWRGP